MSGQQPTIQAWFHEVATHYVEAQVLFHLNQVGVLGALVGREGQSAAALAAELGLDPTLLDVLLDYLAGVDRLVEKSDDGLYTLTPFGAGVLQRFGRTDADGRAAYNLFDVRVGAYGPVWAELGPMLKREKVYGREVHRAGGYAADATYTITPRMAPKVVDLVGRHARNRLVEIGVPTGMLAHMAPQLPGVGLTGLDIDTAALERARQRASETGAAHIQWVAGDLYRPDSWADALSPQEAGAFVTVHLHELASRGMEATRAMLARLSERFPGWLWIALEQDRLPASARETLPSDLWLYAQSNVLIHHLIRNAVIGTRNEWLDLYREAGTTVLGVEELGYLGYSAYVVRL